MKRILTIQDFSCIGKCSITESLPILSAFKLETCCLPTAILSNHTQFKNFNYLDLDKNINDILKNWELNNIKFDGIYTGYLGNIETIDKVININNKFNKGLVLIDPAMGDDGKLYKGFDKKYAIKNKELAMIADIFIPNITEASYILNKEYKDTYDYEYLNNLCDELIKLGSKNIIITGVKKNNKIGVFSKINNHIFEYYLNKVPVDFHGTGDLFSSIIFGSLMNNKSLKNSIKFACKYTKKAIINTLKDKNHIDYGVNFEENIKDIIKYIKEKLH